VKEKERERERESASERERRERERERARKRKRKRERASEREREREKERERERARARALRAVAPPPTGGGTLAELIRFAPVAPEFHATFTTEGSGFDLRFFFFLFPGLFLALAWRGTLGCRATREWRRRYGLCNRVIQC